MNKLNYEGLSALAACHVLFYTKHTWKDNIGETLAEENLFNSVYWNVQNGTFVQRKPIYYQTKTRCKVNESEICSQSRVETKYELNCENAVGNLLEKSNPRSTKKNSNIICSSVGNTIALDSEVPNRILCRSHCQNISQNACEDESEEEHKTDGGFTSNEGRIDYHIPSQSQSLHYVKGTAMEPNQIDINQTDMGLTHGLRIEEDKSSTNIKDLTSNLHTNHCPKKQPKETASLIENKGNTCIKEKAELLSQQGSSNIKEFFVQPSETVDKNTFIHVFLHRAASARSNQDSSTYYDNIDSSNEGTFSDPYYHDENSCNIRGNKNPGQLKDVDLPEVRIAAPDTLESVQYSIQNALSSSLQTANTINDDDSLKSVEQKRQKLLTQQRCVTIHNFEAVGLKRRALFYMISPKYIINNKNSIFEVLLYSLGKNA